MDITKVMNGTDQSVRIEIPVDQLVKAVGLDRIIKIDLDFQTIVNEDGSSIMWPTVQIIARGYVASGIDRIGEWNLYSFHRDTFENETILEWNGSSSWVMWVPK